ncbi:MAG: NAD-dependent epimerase/dehydratase family protein, partial [Oscillospiraceae bacterium]|nr:NAD-dependent epimerase/dehydratase family protein [Oscillospiraceae bacterium]
MRNAVITGATGMLGLALIRLLLQKDFKIYAVVRPNSRRAANIPKDERVKLIECELGDMDKLPGLIEEKCEMFFHFAWRATSSSARNDMGSQIENIRDAVKAAEICADLGCEVFVGAGSQAEYGRHSAPISPQTPAFPENGYGMAKLCA